MDGYGIARPAAPPARHRTPPQFCSEILLRNSPTACLTRSIISLQFKIDASGKATPGAHSVDVYGGVLGRAWLTYPNWAAKAASTTISGHIDIWTVLPAIPPILSTAFEFKWTLKDSTGAEVLCLQVDVAQPPTSGADKSQDKCNSALPDVAPYPPPAGMAIPSVVVDLDDPPEKRWDAIVTPRAGTMQKLIDTFLHGGMANRTIVKLLLAGAADLEMKRMPQDFVKEIKGIAKATKINVGELWVLNMMYELSGFCTSVVAQDDSGQVWHGRNLDFGLFMGNDPKTHTWALTDVLRDLLLNVEFKKGGKTLYSATTYAGFVGLLSGQKTGAFSISVDTRYDGTLDEGVIGWLLGKNDDCQFLTFETRLAIEADHDATKYTTPYVQAFSMLRDYNPLGPAYIIIAGAQSGEGAVIAKAFNATAEKAHEPMTNVDVWPLTEALSDGSFYVLQTNYDRKSAPPGFDDRRYPAENCLDALGPKKLTPAELWKVMSATPTRNAMTTFTQILSPKTGHFESYKQNCVPGPTCAPF